MVTESINAHDALLTLPQDWIAEQVIVFDWFDGPRQGVARLMTRECEFAFDLLAERPNPDGIDDRLFRISELPLGSVAMILETIKSLGNPANTVWIPVWKFGSEQERMRTDRTIDNILTQRKRTRLVIYSRDMVTYLGRWELQRENFQSSDWFTELGIA